MMEYTVKKLAELAGVSARTLRYYDSIGLLTPARVTTSGYRVYGGREVDRLQQILLYREMDVPLETISAILESRDHDRLNALRLHREQLIAKRARLDRLIETVRESIAAEERGIPMDDKRKFEGFKQSLIDENEKRYGAEIREKYGDKTVDESNAKLMGMTKERYDEMEALGAEVLRLLDEAFATKDPRGDLARKTAETHKAWLGFTWSDYSPEAHRGLAEMYAADERFAAYYDRGTPGKAEFLRDCITAWLDTE